MGSKRRPQLKVKDVLDYLDPLVCVTGRTYLHNLNPNQTVADAWNECLRSDWLDWLAYSLLELPTATEYCSPYTRVDEYRQKVPAACITRALKEKVRPHRNDAVRLL
jgi:hypothetical protein